MSGTKVIYMVGAAELTPDMHLENPRGYLSYQAMSEVVKQIEKLRADREKLVEALRFYAEQRNWLGYHRDVDTIGYSDTEPARALSDGFEIMLGGKLARTTLKELGEME